MSCRKAAERRKQENYEESEVEAVRQTAGEAEDGWEAELKTFTPADRITGQGGRGGVMVVGEV